MKRNNLILVVDDDREILKMVGRILELEGYDVITAASGSSALAIFEERRPDLIILDLMLPGLDGFQILRLIRKHSEVPIIVLTGRREVVVLRDAVVLGADDYVRKPFHTAELLARIRAKLRRAGLVVKPSASLTATTLRAA